MCEYFRTLPRAEKYEAITSCQSADAVNARDRHGSSDTGLVELGATLIVAIGLAAVGRWVIWQR